MISTWSLIIWLIMGAAIVGGTIWLLLLIFKEDEDLENETIIFNLMPQYTTPEKGHALGTEVSTTQVDNRYLIEFLPRDIDNKKLKNLKELQTVKIVIDKDKIITLPKGSHSDTRTIKILLGNNPEDYSRALKNNDFGHMLMKYTEKINTENLETSVVREGSKRKTKLLEKLGDGEVSEEFIETQSELTKEIVKQATDISGKKSTTSTFNPVTHQSQ